MSQFTTTKQLFTEATEYTKPLSFSEWDALPKDLKAPVLFVQFFPEITLAWKKVKTPYVYDEDGISEIMKYLLKNVPVIEQNAKRFSANYIYKVAYNCMYCVARNNSASKRNYEHNVSNITISVTGDEVDLFDLAVDIRSIPEEICEANEDKFWELIENQDNDTKKIIECLLKDSNKLKKRKSAKKDKIIQQLRELLAEYNEEV